MDKLLFQIDLNIFLRFGRILDVAQNAPKFLCQYRQQYRQESIDRQLLTGPSSPLLDRTLEPHGLRLLVAGSGLTSLHSYRTSCRAQDYTGTSAGIEKENGKVIPIL
jgi:hypothetical protein